MLENLPGFFDTLIHSEKLIQYGGLTLIVIVIFAETGLFIGFFLPGDYLLFTSGVLCGTNYLDISVFILLFSLTLASVIGNYVGFYTGKTLGKKLFTKPDSRYFKKERVEKAKKFYDEKGALSLILGRFLPIFRTFSPIIAGSIDMDLKKFSYYNWAGGFLWVWSLVLTGYFLGRTYPQIIHYLEYFVFGFIIITTIILIKKAIGK
jgi:membrane-associated protein